MGKTIQFNQPSVFGIPMKPVTQFLRMVAFNTIFFAEGVELHNDKQAAEIHAANQKTLCYSFYVQQKDGQNFVFTIPEWKVVQLLNDAGYNSISEAITDQVNLGFIKKAFEMTRK